MYWSKLFIPTLRDDPAEAQNDAHRLLIRAGYMRGRDYLPLGGRVLGRMMKIVREEMDVVHGQEISISGPARAIAAELRSYRQLPQIWYQFSAMRMNSWSFDLTGEAPHAMSGAVLNFRNRCGIEEEAAQGEQIADPEGDLSPEEFHTPDQKSIADVSRFTGLPATSQMKSLVVIADGEMVLALVRGDHQLDDEKLAWYLDVREIRAARADEIRSIFGADAGSLGPIGVQLRIVADEALRGRHNMICGANRNDYHLRNVTPGEDFLPEFHEIRERPGAAIFRSRQSPSRLQVSNEAAEIVPLTEGACEIFLDRALEAIVEQHRDADGLALGPSIAPFAAVITPVNFADEAQRRVAIDLHDSAAFDVLLDDRDERPGVKFKDADLIGVPYRFTVGRKVSDGVVEVRDRRARTSQDVALNQALAYVVERIK